ncbi:histone-like nucleoid-structuring protein Lsr2 [Nocardia gamkensis]|uniref:Lsr2 family DNA-binding protein n=1 Tax=Nocardia gamkensis TaxID=352869 RepID=UPI0036E19AE1
MRRTCLVSAQDLCFELARKTFRASRRVRSNEFVGCVPRTAVPAEVQILLLAVEPVDGIIGANRCGQRSAHQDPQRGAYRFPKRLDRFQSGLRIASHQFPKGALHSRQDRVVHSRGVGDGASPERQRAKAIREWAAANGHTVSARGRISAAVVEAFDVAQ